MNADEYLSVLNDEQLNAVVHNGNPLLIIAGAGSGKTRVITTKIAYMIQELGVAPYSILALTFTKKAANEMQERARLLENSAVHSQIKTFHSFGSWFLRKHWLEAGLDKNFTIYDDDDAESLMQKAVPALSRNEAKIVAHKISLAKDYFLTSDDDLTRIDDGENFAEYYKKYEERLSETGNVDFGDLILKTVSVMRRDEKILNHMHNLFKVVMVDEYQDTNVAQFELLKTLTGRKTYVCVVGDDDQSIYKFRGAEIENILSFENVFKNADVIRLEKNYRSVPNILNLANSVIKQNTKRLGKNLVPVRCDTGKKAVVAFLPNQNDEADFVCRLISESHKNGVPYSDWAVLYRMNAQSLSFETALLHNQIPYTIIGSVKFYQREEIKDALSFLSFVANPKDEISFRRIINKPARGIGKVSQDAIVEKFFAKKDDNYNLIDASREFAATKNGKVKENLLKFCSLASSLISLIDDEKNEGDTTPLENIALNSLDEGKVQQKKREREKTLSVFIEKMINESGFKEYYETQDEIANTQKMYNLVELENSAFIYPLNRNGLTEFLDHIELESALEAKDEQDAQNDRVILITLHNTKGLEFSRVVITGMENGIFPRGDEVDDELEEERRLFYVGITRAMSEIYFTCCASRVLFGKMQFLMPSRFLCELDKSLFTTQGKVPSSFRGALDSGTKHDAIAERWKRGAKLYHDDYGYGYIIATDKSSAEYVIQVQFENGTVKRFMPRYQANRLTLVTE